MKGQSTITFLGAGLRYFFGTGNTGNRYLKMGLLVLVFWYFPKTSHSVSVFWCLLYFGRYFRKKLAYVKKFKTL